MAGVAAAHAGVVAPLDGIRRAIDLVLDDDRYRAAAQGAAGEMRLFPPAEEFLDLV